MSEAWTPGDADVRQAYAAYAEDAWRSWNPGQPEPEEDWAAPFDRWLQQHDEAIRTRQEEA